MILLKAKRYFSSLKARETISTISLSLPDTQSGVTLDDLSEWIQIPSIRSRVPASIDAEGLVFTANYTDKVLSHKFPTCFSSRGICVLSSEIQFRRRATNYRSLMAMRTFRFVSLMRAS